MSVSVKNLQWDVISCRIKVKVLTRRKKGLLFLFLLVPVILVILAFSLYLPLGKLPHHSLCTCFIPYLEWSSNIYILTPLLFWEFNSKVTFQFKISKISIFPLPEIFISFPCFIFSINTDSMSDIQQARWTFTLGGWVSIWWLSTHFNCLLNILNSLPPPAHYYLIYSILQLSLYPLPSSF